MISLGNRLFAREDLLQVRLGVGQGISSSGQTTIPTNLKPGTVAIVKVGEKAVKVIMKQGNKQPISLRESPNRAGVSGIPFCLQRKWNTTEIKKI